MGTFLGLLLTIIYIYIFIFFLGFVCSLMGNQQKDSTTTVVCWGPPPSFGKSKKGMGKLSAKTLTK